MLKNFLAHPSFAKMPPAMKTTIIIAVLAILALLLPYLPFRRETPSSLTRTDVLRTQPVKRSLIGEHAAQENSAPPPVLKRAPTPTATPDFREEIFSESPMKKTNTLDDLDSLLETEE